MLMLPSTQFIYGAVCAYSIVICADALVHGWSGLAGACAAVVVATLYASVRHAADPIVLEHG